MDLVASCPLCQEPNIDLDTALMLFGPAEVARSRRMEQQAAWVDGILATHWRHLRTALIAQRDTPAEQPQLDADPLTKTRWTQQQLFRLTFGIDDVLPENSAEHIATLRTKNGTLKTLLSSIHLEAELLGHVEKAKIKGKRQAEREMAREEATEDALLSPEDQIKMHINTLRLHGYDVTKNISTESIDVTEE